VSFSTVGRANANLFSRPRASVLLTTKTARRRLGVRRPAEALENQPGPVRQETSAAPSSREALEKRVGAHLVQRSYIEPHWDAPKRGAVKTTGLPSGLTL